MLIFSFFRCTNNLDVALKVKLLLQSDRHGVSITATCNLVVRVFLIRSFFSFFVEFDYKTHKKHSFTKFIDFL